MSSSDLSTSTLTVQLARALEMIESAAADAAARVSSGPDNPAITRVDTKSMDAFTVGIEELRRRGGWDVFRHDWPAQYRFAADLVRARRFAVLRDLVVEGRLRESNYGLRQFAPEVVERIRAIVGDMHLPGQIAEKPSQTAGLPRAELASSASPQTTPQPRRRP